MKDGKLVLLRFVVAPVSRGLWTDLKSFFDFLCCALSSSSLSLSLVSPVCFSPSPLYPYSPPSSHIMSSHIISCLILSYHIIPCLILSILSCRVLSCFVFSCPRLFYKGDEIRELKKSKADKAALQPHIDALIALKTQYKDETGKAYVAPGGTANASGGGGGAKKQPKKVMKPFAKRPKSQVRGCSAFVMRRVHVPGHIEIVIMYLCMYY